MIPYGRQTISQDDIDAVTEVLRSDFLTQGPQVPRFEQAMKQYCGVGHAVAANSATSALHIACLALELGKDDWLWTSPITFVASANCGLYCGAKVDFVDIDPDTFNMCPQALAAKLELAKAEGRLPKIVIPVHLCGQSCDMAAIHALSVRYGFSIVEDASHAIGGSYRQQPVGNCRYSDITVFSFHPVKIVTTAEGGVATTNDAKLAERMNLFRSHGVTRDPGLMIGESDGPWYYQQVVLGLNYRMTDMQAALGVSQMSRLDEFVTRRHELAAYYAERLGNFPMSIQMPSEETYSAFHLFVIRLDSAGIASCHLEIFQKLRQQGIGVNLHYIPVHTQPYYRELGFKHGDFPKAEEYYSSAITLPIYPGLSRSDQDEVIKAVGRTVVR